MGNQGVLRKIQSVMMTTIFGKQENMQGKMFRVQLQQKVLQSRGTIHNTALHALSRIIH